MLPNSPRALSHNDDCNLEQPVFINPANEDAEALITFNEEIPKAVNDNIRGDQTIKKLELDRGSLNEQRMQTLNKVRDIYDLAKVFPETNPILKAQVKNVVQKYYDSSLSDETEYASMLRAFFKKNPL